MLARQDSWLVLDSSLWEKQRSKIVDYGHKDEKKVYLNLDFLCQKIPALTILMPTDDSGNHFDFTV